MAEIDWRRIREDHEVAYFRGEMEVDSPDGSYNIEEMEDILLEMQLSTFNAKMQSWR